MRQHEDYLRSICSGLRGEDPDGGSWRGAGARGAGRTTDGRGGLRGGGVISGAALDTAGSTTSPVAGWTVAPGTTSAVAGVGTGETSVAGAAKLGAATAGGAEDAAGFTSTTGAACVPRIAQPTAPNAATIPVKATGTSQRGRLLRGAGSDSRLHSPRVPSLGTGGNGPVVAMTEPNVTEPCANVSPRIPPLDTDFAMRSMLQ